jgi:hypothetical protein
MFQYLLISSSEVVVADAVVVVAVVHSVDESSSLPVPSLKIQSQTFVDVIFEWFGLFIAKIGLQSNVTCHFHGRIQMFHGRLDWNLLAYDKKNLEIHTKKNQLTH